MPESLNLSAESPCGYGETVGEPNTRKAVAMTTATPHHLVSEFSAKGVRPR